MLLKCSKEGYALFHTNLVIKQVSFPSNLDWSVNIFIQL